MLATSSDTQMPGTAPDHQDHLKVTPLRKAVS
jgi:hypothetical protein